MPEVDCAKRKGSLLLSVRKFCLAYTSEDDRNVNAGDANSTDFFARLLALDEFDSGEVLSRIFMKTIAQVSWVNHEK